MRGRIVEPMISRFNPCFSGRYSATEEMSENNTSKGIVSILVLVEGTLQRPTPRSVYYITQVSILVLVEGTLQPARLSPWHFSSTKFQSLF